MNNLVWTHKAWQDYLYWQTQDKKTLKKINELVKDIERNGALNGIGKPEVLKNESAYSRRIDEKNRLVYRIVDGFIWIIACKGHYEEQVLIMEIKIREIEVEDYKELLDFMKKVKGETNFLLGQPDEMKLSYEDEKEHIKKVKSSETSNHFVAIKGDKIIGCTSFNGNIARKMKHYGTIGISVLKEYWGRGIATALLEKLISWSKEKGIKKINLDVFENNERAIKLYEKFGFKGEKYINLLVYGLKI